MFERLSKLIKGFLSLFISGLETANPKALLEAEVQALHSAVGNYNKNLARQAGLVERLKMQVERDKKEVDRLTAQASALFNAGQMEAAGRGPPAQTPTALADNEAVQAGRRPPQLSQQRDVYVREPRRIENIKQKLSAPRSPGQAQLAGSPRHLFRPGRKRSYPGPPGGEPDQRMTDAGRPAWPATPLRREIGRKAEEEAALEKQALAEFARLGLAAAPAAAPSNLCRWAGIWARPRAPEPGRDPD